MPDAGGSDADSTALLTSRSDTEGRARESHYRPQLDGLRAVAVYLVVAFHAGLGVFSGGFIGVDVFFVLSGYLVTQLLLRDFGATGRVALRRFYSRRFRRLLPAAFVTLVVTAAVYSAVAAPADVHDAIGGFRSAFLYVANWHFIHQSNDYFAADVAGNPVVHFWSLAVEEQFYLGWPLLLSAVYLVCRRAGRRQWKAVRLIVAAGFVASLAAALLISTGNLNRAYYGTDTRAYELLAGALLALTPAAMHLARNRARLVQTLAPFALAALVLIGTSTIHLGAVQRGVAATLATCCLIVALEVAPGGVVRRTLSSSSAVYLGRVSYGTYLWHWPVIVIATQRFHPNPVSLFALTCLVGTALASLSFELLEQRVRLSRLLDRHRSAVIAVGLATSIVGGLLIVPGILDRSDRAAATAAVLGAGASAHDVRVPVPPFDYEATKAHAYTTKDCFGRSLSACSIVQGRGLRILIVGDSHAVALAPALAGLAQTRGYALDLAAIARCPWQQGIFESPNNLPSLGASDCYARQRDWYGRIVPEFRPDVIVLVHRPFDDPGGVLDLQDGKTRLRQWSPEFGAVVRRAARETVAQLARDGRKVVIVEPVPLAPNAFNPTTCLTQAKYVEECRYVAAAPTPLEQYYRSLANGTDVFTVDLDRLVCPYLPICDPIVNGLVVKRDKSHLTVAYSKSLAEPIAAVLSAVGVIPRAP